MKPNHNALALAIAATIATAGTAEAAPLPKIVTKVISWSGNGNSTANLTSSTATWTYDAATGLLAQTGGTHVESFDVTPGTTAFRHSLTGVVIGNGAAATATTYICTEGNFGSGVGASLCGNYNFGGNFTNETATTWGPGTAFARTVGGDDMTLGVQQNLNTQMDGFATVSTTALQVVLSNAVCNPLAPGNANSCATVGGFNQGYTWTLSTPYELIAWHQRSTSGALSSLAFKSGTAQNCPAPIVGALYRQPCYNPAQAWTSSNAVATTVDDAIPQWGWDGTTMTHFGLLWATSFIGGNPSATAVISDRIENLVITPSPTSTSTASSYQCVEGTFLQTVGASGCKNTNLTDGVDNSSITYNILSTGGVPRANCVQRVLGGDDVSTGNPRTVSSTAGGGVGTLACDAGDGGFNLWTVIPNARGLLILANQATITNDGCYMFGRAEHKASSACAGDAGLSGASYMIFAPKVDTDGDKVVDLMDNCLNVANSTQIDSDDDGFGNRCDGDIRDPNNNAVNAQDTTIFKGQIGLSSTYPTYNKADLNANGVVNAQDTTIFKGLLGVAVGPSGIGTYPIPANP